MKSCCTTRPHYCFVVFSFLVWRYSALKWMHLRKLRSWILSFLNCIFNQSMASNYAWFSTWLPSWTVIYILVLVYHIKLNLTKKDQRFLFFFNLKFIFAVSRPFFTAIIESDDLKAVINEMDKTFNYSRKVSKMNSSLYERWYLKHVRPCTKETVQINSTVLKELNWQEATSSLFIFKRGRVEFRTT